MMATGSELTLSAPITTGAELVPPASKNENGASMTRRNLWLIAKTSNLFLESQLFLFHPPNFQVVRSWS
jgi:hypothetical protein